MGRNRRNLSRGFTLVELLVSVGLLSVVLTVGFSMLLFGNKMVKISEDEYDFQFATRTTLQATSSTIRYSTAVFTIPKSKFSAANLDGDWDYIGIVDTSDGEEIVKYIHNGSGGHDATVLIPAQKDVSFKFVFTKTNPSNNNCLLQFTIKTIPAGSLDEYGKPKENLSITSEVESLNSLQVIDPAAAVAFKPDDRTKSVVGHVAMVLDTSGSMADNLNGGTHGQSRISILKTEATAIINKFAQEENVDISLIPFATSANTSGNQIPAFYNAKTKTSDLISKINALTAIGGTNTGDGLRRAYYALEAHNAEAVSRGYKPSNYLIVLVDGVTTFASVVSDHNRSFYIADGNVNDSGYLDRDRSEYNRNSQIAGNGSTLDSDGTRYVNTIGAYFKTGSFAKVYVIGFSALNRELDSVEDIAQACGAASANVFVAGDEDALKTVFEEIEQDIVHDLWYLYGPDMS